MDNLKKDQTEYRNNPKAAHVSEAASELMQDSRKLADEIYKEGLNFVNDAEENVKKYSDELLSKVQKNPLTSVLIAGGIGFLLSTFLKK